VLACIAEGNGISVLLLVEGKCSLHVCFSHVSLYTYCMF
jgi:hypothetical protein